MLTNGLQVRRLLVIQVISISWQQSETTNPSIKLNEDKLNETARSTVSFNENHSSPVNADQEEIKRLKHLSSWLLIISIVFFLVALYSLYKYYKKKPEYRKFGHKTKSKSPNSKRIDAYRNYISRLEKSKISCENTESKSITTEKTKSNLEISPLTTITEEIPLKNERIESKTNNQNSTISENTVQTINTLGKISDSFLCNIQKTSAWIKNESKASDMVSKIDLLFDPMKTNIKKSLQSSDFQKMDEKSVERFFSIEGPEN